MPSDFTYFPRLLCRLLALCRPSRSSNLVPRLAVVGVVLLAILADRSSRKTKKYFDYDKDPADGVEPSQRALPGAGWGMGYLFSLAALHRRNNPCLNVIVISLS